MNITGLDHVYDNCIAKPGPIDDSGRFSMAVLFETSHGVFHGQFEYNDNTWKTLPSDKKMRVFDDCDVLCWHLDPRMKDLLSNPDEIEASGKLRVNLYGLKNKVGKKN